MKVRYGELEFDVEVISVDKYGIIEGFVSGIDELDLFKMHTSVVRAIDIGRCYVLSEFRRFLSNGGWIVKMVPIINVGDEE